MLPVVALLGAAFPTRFTSSHNKVELPFFTMRSIESFTNGC